MDSPSLKVQCQAALALRNLASDGKQVKARLNKINLITLCREVSTGHRKGGRVAAFITSSPVRLPPPHPFLRGMCPKRVYTSSERVTYH